MPHDEVKREGQSKHIEREFEVGKDEAWFANIKRTYDEYLHAGLAAVHAAQAHADDTLADSRAHVARINTLAELALANAITNSDALMKQHLAHRDIATDCTWDPGPGEESLADKK